ncbi:ATP-binding protein [Fodinicurvata halophila]|uniref:histidine kinase n=1 Tax=Fodinicurvata halophila TaxID=1419723 RepID=A0ABV8UNF7_9PROT
MRILDEHSKSQDIGLMSVHRQLLPVIALVVIFLIVAGALLCHTAQEQNEVAEGAERHLAASSISVLRNGIADFVVDYAYWDDTAQHVIIDYDEQWADDNVGQWVVEGLGMDGALVAGSDNRLIHHADDHSPEHLADPARYPEEVTAILSKARTQAGSGGEGSEAATGFFRDEFGLHLAAAAAIVWEDEGPPPLDSDVHGVLFFYRTLDPALLAESGEQFLLKDLRLSSGTPGDGVPHLALASIGGKALGNLRWTSEQPGTAMLKNLVLPLALMAGGTLLIIGLIVQRAYKRARLFRDYHDGLEKQTEELRQAYDAAAALSQSKSHFLAMMSHELRTPLNAIIGFSDFMRQDRIRPLPTERLQEYANDIHASGNYLLDLINDILNMSKIEAQRYELHEAQVKLADLLEQSMTLVKNLADSKTISLHASKLEVQLYLDPLAFKQILLNLLSNAIKYSEPGKNIWIDARQNEDGTLSVSVRDEGVGMTQEGIAAALEPFGQARNSYVRDAQGTGLGLNICQALIELHGGRLDIDSIPQQGTKVTLLLPPDRVVCGADEAPQPQHQLASNQ